jgi:hypothetical protein
MTTAGPATSQSVEATCVGIIGTQSDDFGDSFHWLAKCHDRIREGQAMSGKFGVARFVGCECGYVPIAWTRNTHTPVKHLSITHRIARLAASGRTARSM